VFYEPIKEDVDYIHGHTWPRVAYLNHDGNSRDYDLCPACVDALKAFLKPEGGER
jgi:hypothetical protein